MLIMARESTAQCAGTLLGCSSTVFSYTILWVSPRLTCDCIFNPRQEFRQCQCRGRRAPKHPLVCCPVEFSAVASDTGIPTLHWLRAWRSNSSMSAAHGGRRQGGRVHSECRCCCLYDQ
ncbi:hypothetical protein BD310DRAFT_939504 [Dichomitus squalens]|uniref:Uncharacterized protein n=1 Tax=Dichomitus squalens TaxID=114155 RepID=A0A4Q9PDK0_9APHY|nr:hypothetical protein BD310DRAFT_939504 [Dichomitus squalens]